MGRRVWRVMGEGTGVDRQHLLTMLQVWHLWEARGKDWVEKPTDYSPAKKESWAGRWRAPEQRGNIRGVLCWMEIAQACSSPWAWLLARGSLGGSISIFCAISLLRPAQVFTTQNSAIHTAHVLLIKIFQWHLKTVCSQCGFIPHCLLNLWCIFCKYDDKKFDGALRSLSYLDTDLVNLIVHSQICFGTISYLLDFPSNLRTII